jgi:hypothetical protein
MMGKLFLTLMAVGFFGICTNESYGQQTQLADKREKRQVERIKDGVQDGELNAKETGKLLKGQVKVRKYEHKIKSDGNVTFKERAKLQHKLNKSSRKIYKAKHN